MKRNRVTTIAIAFGLVLGTTAEAQQADRETTPATTNVTTSGGTVSVVPLFTTSRNIQNSILTQSGGGVEVGGSLSASGSVGGSNFKIGGQLFAFGSAANANAFLGFSGNNTMTGTNNTAAGSGALIANTTGMWNAATGVGALAANTTGLENTATGARTLGLNTTGNFNTATGYLALASNTTGGTNIATGGLALASNTVGGSNVADGYQALNANTAGGGNTGSGFYTLVTNTTGNYNTAVGAVAGGTQDNSAITGSDNTFLGSGAYLSTGTLANATAIGALALVSQSNAMVLGSINGVNQATSDTYVGIATTAPTNIFTIGQGHGQAIADGWTTYSSRRWKTNIQTLPDALEKVEQLRGVSYDMQDSGKHEVGVIAEEVGAVVPEVVTFEANGKDARGVDYSRLTALLIEAVKQQQKEITSLRAQLAERATDEAALESRLSLLEKGSAIDHTHLASAQLPTPEKQ